MNLRFYVGVTAGLFVLLLVLAFAGNALQASGAVAASPAVELAAKIVFLVLTLALFLSAVPLIIKAVLQSQVRLGDADRPLIRALLAHERRLVLAYWIIVGLGMAVSLPAAITAGAFTASAGPR